MKCVCVCDERISPASRTLLGQEFFSNLFDFRSLNLLRIPILILFAVRFSISSIYNTLKFRSRSHRPPIFIVKVPSRSPSAHSCSRVDSSGLSCEFQKSPTTDLPTRLSHSSHSCHESSCQDDMDDYFLDRIEMYAPVLQRMREHSKHEPIVVVTNWQHTEHYPSDWVVRFQEVCCGHFLRVTCAFWGR